MGWKGLADVSIKCCCPPQLLCGVELGCWPGMKGSVWWTESLKANGIYLLIYVGPVLGTKHIRYIYCLVLKKKFALLAKGIENENLTVDLGAPSSPFRAFLAS